MQRLVSIILVALAVGAAPLPGAAARLVRTVTVDAEIIRLGDLFEFAAADPKHADGMVTTAPLPGKRKVFGTRQLSAIARKNGIAWSPRDGYDRVIVRRDSIVIDAVEIAEAVRSALVSRQGVPQDYRVELSNRSLKVHAATGQPDPFRIERLRYNKRTGGFAATLIAPSGLETVTRVKISGRAYELVNVPVLSHTMRPGDIIGEGDIEWSRIRASRARRRVILDPARIVGKTPRRLLQADKPLREGDVRAPIVVDKGSLVTLALHTERMVLTVRVKAIEDGAKGQIIRVINMRSRKTIEGIVTAPGVVTVPGPALPLIARRTQ